jgi:hypothetical protein
MLTNETSIQEMSTDDFRQRLIERVKRQATDTDESTIRVQEIIKSIERLPDSRIKDLQEQEVLSMTNTRMQSNTGGLLGDLDKDGKLSGYEANRQKAIEDNMRDKKQEGGSMLVPPEMDTTPIDTYPNVPPEEMAEVEASQEPDEVMEDNYEEFVLGEAISPEDNTYLMTALNSDPKLQEIFSKIMDTAFEFSGAGKVEGPGTGVSDSIPARLSDGEFVITKKATDQIGADNLQTMMDNAERAYDGGLQGYELGGLLEKRSEETLDGPQTEKLVRQKMINADRMPSIRR